VAIIPLAPALLSGSSDLPESYPREGVGGAGAPPLLFGLAPCGVYPAPDITIGAVRSYPAERGCRSHPHLFTLTSPLSPNSAETREPAVCFLWHFPYRRRTVRFADIPLRPSLLASTLPCGVRTFLPPARAACDPVRTERDHDRRQRTRAGHRQGLRDPGQDATHAAHCLRLGPSRGCGGATNAPEAALLPKSRSKNPFPTQESNGEGANFEGFPHLVCLSFALRQQSTRNA